MSGLTEQDAERFWPKVDRSGGPDACWPWTGGTNGAGYGIVWPAGSKKERPRRQLYAHRVAYELTHGPLPEGSTVRQSCENRLCCNPKDLVATSADEQLADARVRRVERGYALGSERHGAKLTEAAAAEIRALNPASHAEKAALAERFGVSVWTINDVLAGRKWRHV